MRMQTSEARPTLKLESDVATWHEPVELQLQRMRRRLTWLSVIASLAVGFIAGRASVWLMPFEASPGGSRQNVAAGQVQPEPSEASRREAIAAIKDLRKPHQPAPPGDGAQPVQSHVPAPASEASPPPTEKPASTAGDTPAERQPSPPAPPGGSRPPPARFTLINPGAAETGPAPQLPTSGAERGIAAALDVEECERRYASFRRSDGTYQPYGGGPRQRCPHLR